MSCKLAIVKFDEKVYLRYFIPTNWDILHQNIFHQVVEQKLESPPFYIVYQNLVQSRIDAPLFLKFLF